MCQSGDNQYLQAWYIMSAPASDRSRENRGNCLHISTSMTFYLCDQDEGKERCLDLLTRWEGLYERDADVVSKTTFRGIVRHVTITTAITTLHGLIRRYAHA